MGSISEPPATGSPNDRTIIDKAITDRAITDRAITSNRPSLDAHSRPIIYSRDFAYIDNATIIVVPARVVRADVLTSSAKTFAGYVALLPSRIPP